MKRRDTVRACRRITAIRCAKFWTSCPEILATKWTLGTEVVLAFDVYNPALPVNIKTEVEILKIHFSIY